VTDARLIMKETCDACGLVIEVIDPRSVIRWEIDWVTYSCQNCGHVMRLRYASGGDRG
jgi:uncharacterized Zn finger protein